MNRAGIVLFMSVGLIMILIPLIWKSLALASANIDTINKYKEPISDSILISDIIGALNQQSILIKDSDDLDNIFIPLPIVQSSLDELSLNVVITPMFDKININNLLVGNKENPVIKRAIYNLAQKYELINVDFLYALILDTLDKDIEERAAFSEIKLIDKDFRNSLIFSKEHMQVIVEQYVKYTYEVNAYEIDWEEFFYFYKQNSKQMLDCDRMSDETAKLLGLNLGVQSVCDAVSFDENKEIVEAMNIRKFNKSLDYFIRCNIEIYRNKSSQLFEVIYNIKNAQALQVKKVLG